MKYRGHQIEVWTTSVLNVGQFHLWAAVKSVLVERALLTKLWCEGELLSRWEPPPEWGDIRQIKFGDDLVKKLEKVRVSGNNGVAETTGRQIRQYLARKAPELGMADHFIDVERQFFLSTMGERGHSLMAARVHELIFPNVAVSEPPLGLRAVMQHVVKLHKSELADFIPEGARTELEDLKDVVQELLQMDEPTFQKKPTKVICINVYIYLNTYIYIYRYIYIVLKMKSYMLLRSWRATMRPCRTSSASRMPTGRCSTARRP